MTATLKATGPPRLPTVGLGCGNFGEFLDAAASRRVIEAALEAGVTHFDTADVYGDGASERYLGEALDGRRDEVLITTKFGAVGAPAGPPPGAAASVRRSCEASLRRLGRDWIDFYLFHHPDPQTPVAETLMAMVELRREGKVRAIGCSNFSPAQLEEAVAAADEYGVEGFGVAQNAYSLLDRTAERELLPACAREGIAFIPYLPLAGGMLTGKYRHGREPDGTARMSRQLRGAEVREYFPALLSDECFEIVESLTKFADDHGHSLLEIAFGWLLSNPVVSGVIAGATSPRQLHDNIAAIGAWALSTEERAAVDRLTRDDVAFAWHPGMPEYTQPPAGTLADAPDLRENVARER